MGNNPGKERIDLLERQHQELMKKNADMVQHLADQQAANERQNRAALEQMAKMIILVAAAAGTKNDGGQAENKEIEIEGTTYQLVEFVNRGGFGEVHKAKVKNRNTVVAVKVMKNIPGMAEEVKNEIAFLRLMKQIPIENHPVIEFYGSKVSKEHIFIAMELAACDLVTFWLNTINDGEAEKIVIMGMIMIVYVLRALTFLEKLNIIHGDIKPQNLVIVPTGQAFCIKLIDFGTVEKMHTRCAQLTVDQNKAFTLFFVSPEFLKRDANNLVSRHLHKKSDAWAAGVMFYLLFCGELPWKDQHDYENFCNDRNRKDVTVPDIGGYKTIIELLLKKNPHERSSAKATLMQIKSHPTFSKIVQPLHENFCPVDDVCHMRVPDEVRQGLTSMARPGHVARESSVPPGGARRSCRYGRDCYRKDKEHRQEFAHPGDSDYHSAPPTGADKPKCRYGDECFRRTDREHLERFSHPREVARAQPEKQRCHFGATCYNNDPDHRRQFIHPMTTGNPRAAKEKCRFGDSCTKRGDREHMKTYLHD